jgi:hypothetical protein
VDGEPQRERHRHHRSHHGRLGSSVSSSRTAWQAQGFPSHQWPLTTSTD